MDNYIALNISFGCFRLLSLTTGQFSCRLSVCVNLRYFIFLIGRSLGSGTFGKVRIGTHTITGEKVAIKILEKDRIKDKGDVERVTREINILKKVRHPNVI